MFVKPHIFAKAIFSTAVGLLVGSIFPPVMPFIAGGLAGAMEPRNYKTASLMTSLIQLSIALPGFAIIYHVGLAINREVPPIVEVLLFIVSRLELSPELYTLFIPGAVILLPLFNLVGGYFGSYYSD